MQSTLYIFFLISTVEIGFLFSLIQCNYEKVLELSRIYYHKNIHYSEII